MKRKLFPLLIVVLLGAGLWTGSSVSASLLKQDEPVVCAEVMLHYHREAGDYEDWGLHAWGPTSASGVTWTTPCCRLARMILAMIWQVPMEDGAEFLNYIIHMGETKDPGPDQQMKFEITGCEIWLVEGDATQYTNPDDALSRGRAGSGC